MITIEDRDHQVSIPLYEFIYETLRGIPMWKMLLTSRVFQRAFTDSASRVMQQRIDSSVRDFREEHPRIIETIGSPDLDFRANLPEVM